MMPRFMLDTDTCSSIMKRSHLFIAAHARALGLTLVTHNTAEFERVKALTVENWSLPSRRKR